MGRSRINDSPSLAVMADLVVAGKVDKPNRGRSSGVERAARMVAEWTLFPRKLENNKREVKRLSDKYRRNQSELEAVARRRLQSGEAAASLAHFTGLGRGTPASAVAYYDSKLARLSGNPLAQWLDVALRAVDLDALRGARDCRELARTLEREAESLEGIAKAARIMAENLAD